MLLCAHSPLVWSAASLTLDFNSPYSSLRALLSDQLQLTSIKHLNSLLLQAGLLSYLPRVSSLCTQTCGSCPADGRPHQSTGFVILQERIEQGSNYNGMRGRGIVRGRTDAERQEKTIRLIQLINIINVIIFLLWFKHSVQKSCLLVRVSHKSLQTQKEDVPCCNCAHIEIYQFALTKNPMDSFLSIYFWKSSPASPLSSCFALLLSLNVCKKKKKHVIFVSLHFWGIWSNKKLQGTNTNTSCCVYVQQWTSAWEQPPAYTNPGTNQYVLLQDNWTALIQDFPSYWQA